MSQSNLPGKALPPAITNSIRQIGKRIRIARLRRNLTMEEMASRMYITRKTLARLEKGEPGVSLAVLASALWVLGLDESLQNIADLARDTVGLFHERKKLPKRAGTGKQASELDF
jgi:transcriptional regulator with XRE-family HTH domain